MFGAALALSLAVFKFLEVAFFASGCCGACAVCHGAFLLPRLTLLIYLLLQMKEKRYMQRCSSFKYVLSLSCFGSPAGELTCESKVLQDSLMNSG